MKCSGAHVCMHVVAVKQQASTAASTAVRRPPTNVKQHVESCVPHRSIGTQPDEDNGTKQHANKFGPESVPDKQNAGAVDDCHQGLPPGLPVSTEL